MNSKKREIDWARWTPSKKATAISWSMVMGGAGWMLIQVGEVLVKHSDVPLTQLVTTGLVGHVLSGIGGALVATVGAKRLGFFDHG